MASQRNGEREHVLRVVEIIEAEGLQGIDIHFDEICDPAFEWRPTMVGAETYQGREGYRSFLEELVSAVTDISFRVDEVRSVDGGCVLVLGHLKIGREESKLAETEYALLCKVEGGLLTEAAAYPSHAAAEEAVRA
jgi:ketosteroid isomerase-like protein